MEHRSRSIDHETDNISWLLEQSEQKMAKIWYNPFSSNMVIDNAVTKTNTGSLYFPYQPITLKNALLTIEEVIVLIRWYI